MARHGAREVSYSFEAVAMQVRLVVVTTGEANDGVLCVKPYSRPFKPIITIVGLARRVELGELIDERLEFVFKTHHTVKISPSAHWFHDFRASAPTQHESYSVILFDGGGPHALAWQARL